MGWRGDCSWRPRLASWRYLWSSALWRKRPRHEGTVYQRFSLFDRLVGEGPEVCHYTCHHGRFYHSLGEEDADQILLRIRIAYGPNPAGPAEASRCREKVDAFDVDAHAEPPAGLEPAMSVAEEQLHAFLVRGCQMIHRHKYN